MYTNFNISQVQALKRRKTPKNKRNSASLANTSKLTKIYKFNFELTAKIQLY